MRSRRTGETPLGDGRSASATVVRDTPAFCAIRRSEGISDFESSEEELDEPMDAGIVEAYVARGRSLWQGAGRRPKASRTGLRRRSLRLRALPTHPALTGTPLL